MVVHIIKWVFILNIFIPTYTQAENIDNELYVSIYQKEKQLGQYFRIKISYTGSHFLENLNLDKWKQDFSIIHEDEYKDKNAQGKTIQILKLRLYPRFGKIEEIPSLQLGAARSISIKIKIKPPHIKNKPISLNWGVSTTSPWQREAVIIRVHIQSSEPTAHVVLDSPKNKDSLLRVLKTKQRMLENGDIIFDAGWIYYSTESGNKSINLPAIRYQLSGSERRRFYLPLQHFNIKPLPNYLPPDLPIGKLNLKTLVQTENINQWETTIKTPALIPYGISGLDQQLAIINSNDITYTKTQYQQLSNYDNYGDQLTVQYPLPNWLMPFGNSIKIKLRHFNPETGKIEETWHKLPRYWNMPQWAWWLTLILSSLVCIGLIKHFQLLLTKKINKIYFHKQLKHISTANQLRSLILNDGQYIVLREWSSDNNARTLFVDKLNKTCFSNNTQIEIQLLKLEILKLI